MISRLWQRIRGTLLDRIGVFVEVSLVEYEKLMLDDTAEPSAKVSEPVAYATR